MLSGGIMKRISPVLLIAILWMSACASAGAVPADPPSNNLRITTSSLAPATVGEIYTFQLTASGGHTSAYSWNILSGQLPPGITLSNSGVLSGIPKSFGAFTFTVQVSEASKSAQILKIEWRTT